VILLLNIFYLLYGFLWLQFGNLIVTPYIQLMNAHRDDVIPVHVYPAVAVWSVHLVPETDCVPQFVDHNSKVPAALPKRQTLFTIPDTSH
jgi:hypothetical protein